MPKYRSDRVKHTSSRRRYEYLREQGIQVDDQPALRGEALDDYIDRKIWEAAHPGEDPVREWEA